MESQTKSCQNCKNDFIIEPADFEFYEKMKVPPPTFCPDCRLQRRIIHYNERVLYKKNCDLCGESMIAMYSPDSERKVYCMKCWWSDKWDGIEYAMDYDSSKPFLEQLIELEKKTPHMALSIDYTSTINSDYTNFVGHIKNCYLIALADFCENVMYSRMLMKSKDSADSLMLYDSELCYGLINCSQCYKSFYSEDCEQCQEIYFCKNCTGCSNCFGSANLRNKQFHIFNRPYSKEEYFKKIAQFGMDRYSAIKSIKEEASQFWIKFPRKFAHVSKNVNTTGDYIYNSKNCKNMYLIREGAEDCRYCQEVTIAPLKDVYDYTQWGNNASLVYECVSVGEGANSVCFSAHCWPNVRDIQYSFYALSSSNMFGCVNIRNKQYCILNKQYTKEEYEKLIAEVKEQMDAMPYKDTKGNVYKYGEFLPPEISPFSYNETLAQEYFPLTKEQVLDKGFKWNEPKERKLNSVVGGFEMPDSIKDVSDDILNQVIECAHKGTCNEQCTQAFKIIKAELEFYRKMNLPLPRICPNCRHYQRIKQRNPLKLWKRKCQCNGVKSENGVYQNTTTHQHGEGSCENSFETTYAPDRPEIVYCEACYNAEVV